MQTLKMLISRQIEKVHGPRAPFLDRNTAQASDKSGHLLNSEHRNAVNCFRSNYYMQSYNSSKYDPFVEKLVGRLGSPKTRQIVIESYNYLTPYNKFSGLQQKDS